MVRPGKRGAGMRGGEAKPRLVVRRCRVCEWKDQVVETAARVDPDCPWCHGPTSVEQTVDVQALADELTGKNPHAAALGRLGGIKGGHIRAQKLSPKRRREIASKAAKARWSRR